MVTVFNGWTYIASGFKLDNRPNHFGIDLHCYSDNPKTMGEFIEDAKIYSNVNGMVVFSGKHNSGANLVVIKDADGLLHHYAHLSIIKVFNNKIITIKDEIGIIGNTGNSSGIHLHYEIKNKNHQVGLINPCEYCGVDNIVGAAFPPKGW